MLGVKTPPFQRYLLQLHVLSPKDPIFFHILLSPNAKNHALTQ
jgi:hypothetical protein